MKYITTTAILGLALVAGTAPATATTITFSGSGTGVDGAALSAQAIFDFDGNTLTVTLINSALSDNTNSGQDVPGNSLTGVFFALTGNPLLSPVSASIEEGALLQSLQCNPGMCDGSTTDVGFEFRYATGAFPGGSGQGIASSGYIGGNGNFGGVNLDDPDAVDGPNFAIVSADPSFNPNGGLQNVPLIQTQVVFVLTGVANLSVDDISNVSFQYGTGLTEPNIPGDECIDCAQDAPEPGTLMLLGWGLAALGLYRRRL